MFIKRLVVSFKRWVNWMIRESLSVIPNYKLLIVVA